MTQSTRVVAVATIASFAVGVLAVCAVVLAGEPAETIRYSLTSSRGASNLLVIALVSSIPISIPTGVVGGTLAAIVLRRERSRSGVRRWVGPGCAWGAALGAAGTVLWLLVLNVGEGSTLFVALAMAPIGAVSGALVGGLVGVYCNRVSRGGLAVPEASTL